MSGWWQQPTWRTAASCQISSWWHLSYTFATKDCKLHVSLTQTHASIYSLSLHKPQCTFNLSPARLRVNAEKHLLPIVAQREDPSLLWDRKFSGHGLNMSLLSPVTKSESYWAPGVKHVPTDSCFPFRNFPPMISAAVCDWWGYHGTLSRFILLSWSIKNSSHVLKVTIYQ